MASGDRAGTGRKKPKGEKAKPSVKMDDKAQSERFIEAARALDVEEIDKRFDENMKTILRNNIYKK